MVTRGDCNTGWEIPQPHTWDINDPRWQSFRTLVEYFDIYGKSHKYHLRYNWYKYMIFDKSLEILRSDRPDDETPGIKIATQYLSKIRWIKVDGCIIWESKIGE